jgi:hypothetical protein
VSLKDLDRDGIAGFDRSRDAAVAVKTRRLDVLGSLAPLLFTAPPPGPIFHHSGTYIAAR